MVIPIQATIQAAITVPKSKKITPAKNGNKLLLCMAVEMRKMAVPGRRQRAVIIMSVRAIIIDRAAEGKNFFQANLLIVKALVFFVCSWASTVKIRALNIQMLAIAEMIVPSSVQIALMMRCARLSAE